MPQITLHQPVLGQNPGDKVDLSAEDAEWYVQQGYASKVRGTESDDFGLLATSSDADKDPTLAENREAPGKVEPHLSNEADPEPTADQVKVDVTPKTGKRAAEQSANQPSGGPKNIPTPEHPNVK